MTAPKAQCTPFEKVRVLQRKLYRAAKTQPQRTFGWLFYEGNHPPPAPRMRSVPAIENLLRTADEMGPDADFLRKLRRLWLQIGNVERDLLMELAKGLANREEKESAEAVRLKTPP